MRIIIATISALLAVVLTPSTVFACLPVVEASLPIGLHDAIIGAFEIQDSSQREKAIEGILRAYLAQESREVVHQTLVFLLQNERWIDLRQFNHLIPSISPNFTLESWLAASVFDKNRLRREPLDYRRDLYRTALMEGKVELPNGSTFDRDDAARRVASSSFTDLMPLVEEYFSETRMAVRHGVTFSEFERDYELVLEATGVDGTRLLAVRHLSGIEEHVFRERMNSEDDFREQALRVFDYVCAQNPFTGTVEPACEYVLQIYIREQCFWLEELRTILKSGGRPPMPGPCGSHPVTWIGSLERYSFQGRAFKAQFNDARKGMEGCDF